MVKKTFISALFVIVLFNSFSQTSKIPIDKAKNDKTQVIKAFDNYKIEALYKKETYPGDPIFVRLKLEPTNRKIKKMMLSDSPYDCSIRLKKTENTIENSKILEKSALYKIDFDLKRKTDSFLGAIPTSTYTQGGEYLIELSIKVFEQKEETLVLPVYILPKDFISETIPLNTKNTAIRTDSSKTRMAQIERLNSILFAVNENSIFETDSFSYPTTATRRTSFFSDRRIFAYSNGKTDTSLHHGIDWGVPTGTEVFACGRGKIVLAEDRLSTGWSVCIEHLPGLYSLYYHMSALDVTEGQIVEKGDRIGLSGATGLATGPHIHWEVRLNAKSVNPDWFVENSW